MVEVLHLFPPFVQSRECEQCSEDHNELGLLCKACRARLEPVPDTFITSSVASCIVHLERLQRQGAPLAGPLGEAMSTMRKLYDVVSAPVIQTAAPGEIHFLDGEFWGVPAEAEGVHIGPFGSADLAETALVEFVAKSKEPR